MTKRIASLVALAILAGCAGAPAKKAPPALLEAIAHNQRGVREEGRGNHDRALAEFSESLRMHAALENTDGMVVALVNLSRTRRGRGELGAAHDCVEHACALLKAGSDLAAEAYFERAKVELAAGDLSAARNWAERSLAVEKGDGLSRRTNLLALVKLRQQLLEEARRDGERALQLAKDEGTEEESANALRLLGDVALTDGRGDAGGYYEAALQLDKKLGQGKKIALDLRGLGGVSAKASSLAAAAGFYQRALEVSINGGDTLSAADDMGRLAQLYEQMGDHPRARKTLESRQALQDRGKK